MRSRIALHLQKKRKISEMVSELCEWYGVDEEELKTIGCFVAAYMENDYLGMLVVYEEWRDKYCYNEGSNEGER